MQETKLILVHGLGQTSSSWDKTIFYLSDKITVTSLDLTKFTSNFNCTYGNLYDAFSEYCNSFSEPLNLCGLSLGAVLALNYAIDNPQKVKSLILIAAQYKMPKFLLKFQNFIFRFMHESSFKSIGFSKKDFISLTNSMAELNFDNKLHNITCPVLIACGENDSANQKASQEIAKKLSNSDFIIISNSGREVNVDNPQGLSDIIIKFYNKL